MKEADDLIEIVEGMTGALKHGSWRDEKGFRLKDTKEWVAFYNRIRALSSHASEKPTA